MWWGAKRIICPATCPMLNKYGVCESAMRRAERVLVCPHDRLREAVFKLDTKK